MAITCWAPECNHNNVKDTCKFFRFPLDMKTRRVWLTLLRRDAVPGTGARVCSCHFRDGKKENGPEIFLHSKGKLFEKHHLSPEKRKSRRKMVPSFESEPSTSTRESDSLQVSGKQLKPRVLFELE
ncbi:hypothetical protein NQ318_011936, partial [Aromia moschata]